MVHWTGAAGRRCGCLEGQEVLETARLLPDGEEDPPGAEEEQDALEGLPASVVQFSTEQFFCVEEEGHAMVDVVRLGDAAGTARCRYRTQDGSAKAGSKYVAVSGELEFKPGESTQTISIPLLVNESWDSTLEFSVELTKVWGAHRGQYLKRCLVSVIDDDAFPTNKYSSQSSSQEELEEISGIALLFEYMRMNFTHKDIRQCTLIFLALDQIKNMYYLLTIYLNMYLVDVVLGGEDKHKEHSEAPERRLLQLIHAGAHVLGRALGEEGGEEEEAIEGDELIVPGNRRYTAVIVGLLYIIPFGALHMVDTWKLKLKLPGKLRKMLQSALMRKFLTFREDIRGSISTGDLSMAMTRDISEVVQQGYMKIISLACAVGKLGLALMFIMQENKLATVPLVVFLVIGGVFLKLRESLMVQSNEDMATAQNHMVYFIHDAIANERLISSFNLRPFIVDRFEKTIDAYNGRAGATAAIMMNNAYLPPWVTTVLIGGYMVCGTFQVKRLGGTLSLGAYLATLNVFKEVGADMSELIFQLMEILKVSGPLRSICFFMNQPTFMHQLMQRNRERRRVGKERRLDARKHFAGEEGMAGVARSDDGKVVFAVDTLQIEFNDVTFHYGARLMLDRVNRKFKQGYFYGFVGPQHEGKGTLLRILGGVLFPGEGSILIPVHLRLLHLGAPGLFLNGSLLTNILFDRDLNDAGGLDRVRRICRRCGFSAENLRLLDMPRSSMVEGGTAAQSSSDWAKRFSSTEFAKLNLARALVMNPECIVMHMPLNAFTDAEARKMLDLLRTHINERGLELPPEGRKLRRPRTVFFSSSTLERCSRADLVFEVSREHGLRELLPAQRHALSLGW